MKVQPAQEVLFTTSSSLLLTSFNCFSIFRYRIQSQLPTAAADITLRCLKCQFLRLGIFWFLAAFVLLTPQISHSHDLHAQWGLYCPPIQGVCLRKVGCKTLCFLLWCLPQICSPILNQTPVVLNLRSPSVAPTHRPLIHAFWMEHPLLSLRHCSPPLSPPSSCSPTGPVAQNQPKHTAQRGFWEIICLKRNFYILERSA